MKRFLAVQHTFAEFFGALEAQWEARDIGFRYVRPVSGEDVAGTPSQFDALWLLGAAWPPADREHCPWVDDELRLVRAFLKAKRPVIGLGEGAQVLAAAHGALLHAEPAHDAYFTRARALADDPLARELSARDHGHADHAPAVDRGDLGPGQADHRRGDLVGRTRLRGRVGVRELALDRLLGGEQVARAVDVALEGDALLGDLGDLRQRHDLEAAGRILTHDFTRYDGAHAVFQPRHMTPEELEAGYRRLDAYTPFPVEGLADAIGFHTTRVPLIVLIGGLIGCFGGFFLQYYPNVIGYPLNVGGKPYDSWPSFIPITFELIVLLSAFGAFGSVFVLNLLLVTLGLAWLTDYAGLSLALACDVRLAGAAPGDREKAECRLCSRSQRPGGRR